MSFSFFFSFSLSSKESLKLRRIRIYFKQGMIEATEEEKKIVEFHFNIDLSRGIIDKKYNLVTRDNRQVASKL